MVKLYFRDFTYTLFDSCRSVVPDNKYVFCPLQVPVISWFDDMSDTELLDLIPFFEKLSRVDDVYSVLKQRRTAS